MFSSDPVKSMREELTELGIQELTTPEQVSAALGQETATTLVVVNSVCGCAGGVARPAIAQALRHAKIPEKLYTVFAGQDHDATAKARSYFVGQEPSSPSFTLLKGGKVVSTIPRERIQGRSPDAVAKDLIAAFEANC